jgi:hypothetical protein
MFIYGILKDIYYICPKLYLKYQKISLVFKFFPFANFFLRIILIPILNNFICFSVSYVI